MKYLEKKKLAFMSIVNQIKGFVRTVTGIPPLTLTDCVDEDSIINYTIDGDSIQNGTPTPEAPVEVESVGEKTINLFNPEEVIAKFESGDTYKVGSYTCTSIQLKPNTKYYIKTFTPVYTGGYFYLSVNKSVNNTSSGTIDLNDAVGNAYPRGQEEAVTTGDTGCMYVGYLYISNRDKALREGSIQIVEGSYTKATAPDYEPYGKYKIPVVCSGINLFPSGEEKTIVSNGIEIISDGKGTYTIRGTSTASPVTGIFNLSKNFTFPISVSNGGTGVLHLNNDTANNNAIIHFYKDDVKVDSWTIAPSMRISSGYVALGGKVCNQIGLYISANTTVNMTLSPMVVNNIVEPIPFEPYVEPTTTNIYLDEPLAEGQTINYKADNLPKLPTFKGTTIYSIDTEVQPSNMSATYYSTAKE